MSDQQDLIAELNARFSDIELAEQQTPDDAPTVWVGPENLRDVLAHLKSRCPMLFDLTGIDERARREACSGEQRAPVCDFSVVYYLLSIDDNSDIRVKVPLAGKHPCVASVTDIWPNADWYERELWDMFGITVDGHPNLRRILMPSDWEGHPLRKDYPARATDLPGYSLPEQKENEEEQRLQVVPEDYGLSAQGEDEEVMVLNFGPHHPGTHGLLRLVLQLDGEEIVDCAADIGWHHRGAEKMAERQTFHTFIPYTDRIDYLSGLLNNMPYVLSVEKIAGIEIPERAQVIRVMLSELWRIANHLVWFGTFAADVGALSPVFFTFNDRERVFDIMEAICGFRMHPAWFRIGGVAADLPDGWKGLVDDFLAYFPRRIDEYDSMIAKNSIFKNLYQRGRKVHAAGRHRVGGDGAELAVHRIGLGPAQEASLFDV